MFPEAAEPETVSEGHRRLVPEPLVLVLLCVHVTDGYPEGAQRVGDDFSNLKKNIYYQSRLRRIARCIGPNKENHPILYLLSVWRYKICQFTKWYHIFVLGRAKKPSIFGSLSGSKIQNDCIGRNLVIN